MCEVCDVIEFFSEENLNLHREYVRRLRLKYSIIESSLPQLSGVPVKGILNLRLGKRDRDDALRLLAEITLHEIFFSSFAERRNARSERLARRYGSEAGYLDMLYRLTRDVTHGFLVIMENGDASVLTEYYQAFSHSVPALAVDLCEHAYFLDYAFDRERYIIACLSRLNIGKIKT